MMKRREVFLDILRIICIFLVLYVHTGEKLMYAWIGKIGLEYWFGLFMTQLSVCGTSVFFMISGYLLLDRKEELKYVLVHRVLRYAVLLVFFGFFQQIYEACIYGTWSEMSLPKMLNRIYSTEVIGQYWFLYAYLGFLLILVFLRFIAAALTREGAGYLVALFLIFNVFTVFLERAADFDEIYLKLPVLEAIVFLPLLGYCIKTVFKEYLEKRGVRAGIYLTGALALAFSGIYSSYTYRNWGISYGFDGIYILVSVAVFVLIRQLFAAKTFSKGAEAIIGVCGQGVLLIFLAEVQLKDATVFIYDKTVAAITWFPAGVLWLIACFVLGTLFSFLLRKIPGVNKFI